MVKKPSVICGESTSIAKTCPVCDSSDISVFIEIPEVPVHCNLLHPTRDQAMRARRGDIQLAFCTSCGHVFNIAFDPDPMKYSQEYENSLHFSPRFQEYAKSLAARLIERYDLHNKDIIEIGCGKGDFLRLLCKLGGNRGVGFDPSYVPKRTDKKDKEQITFIRDFYSERYASYKADLICCRHVLEHIQFPRDFLISLLRTIGNQTDTAVFFEVPNVMFTLRDLSIWDIIYEHCAYFSLSSLARLFTSCGFEVSELAEAFGGQFLCVEAFPLEDSADSRRDHWNVFEGMAHDVATFSETYQRKVQTWKNELDKLGHEGKRVVVWGGGSKGVTFLNTLKADQIKYVVDINPHKHGMHVAGTGQNIVPPKFLREYQPDTVVVMNPIYTDEIRRAAKNVNVNAKIVTV